MAGLAATLQPKSVRGRERQGVAESGQRTHDDLHLLLRQLAMLSKACAAHVEGPRPE